MQKGKDEKSRILAEKNRKVAGKETEKNVSLILHLSLLMDCTLVLTGFLRFDNKM